jgi:hypothetical protein
MTSVQPEVFLVARPEIDYEQLAAYLHEVGGEKWLEKLERGDLDNGALNLAEFAGRLCYDTATEILTEGGWRRFEALDQDLDRVLTWNRATERAEFQPFSVVRYDYKGPMLQIRQRGLDLLVTPEHRLWVQKTESQGRWSPWHFATAETVSNHGPVLDDIRATVEGLGLSWREYCDPRKPLVVTMRISGGGDFARRVQADAGSRARNKRIPRWLMEHRDARVLEVLWACKDVGAVRGISMVRFNSQRHRVRAAPRMSPGCGRTRRSTCRTSWPAHMARCSSTSASASSCTMSRVS